MIQNVSPYDPNVFIGWRRRANKQTGKAQPHTTPSKKKELSFHNIHCAFSIRLRHVDISIFKNLVFCYLFFVQCTVVYFFPSFFSLFCGREEHARLKQLDAQMHFDASRFFFFSKKTPKAPGISKEHNLFVFKAAASTVCILSRYLLYCTVQENLHYGKRLYLPPLTVVKEVLGQSVKN